MGNIEKLKTDFKQDIIDTSVNEKRKYRMIENSDGTISLEDETVYMQIGDDFGAEEINNTNGTVNELIDEFSDIESGKTAVEKSKTADNATVADSVKNDFILINQQVLTFTNKICTISNDRITADSLADVYFTADSISIAENAVISVETYNGKVELTAGREPEGIIRASIDIRVV